MKYRYFIQLSYKGTNYHGWQVQPNAITIQSVLNKAFSTILREKIELTGAGRTDTGVHAKFFIAHFDSSVKIETKTFIFRINCFLPFDIAIQKIYQVSDSAHSRFDAISRTYKYHISQNKNPFIQEYSYFYNKPLDIEKMNEAAKILFDYSDFTSFSKTHTDTKTNLCKIHFAEWKKTPEKLIFTIKADRFLRNMVRAITGTLIDIGSGKMRVEEIRKIIESKNRSSAGYSVPAQGLFLTGIEYPV